MSISTRHILAAFLAALALGAAAQAQNTSQPLSINAAQSTPIVLSEKETRRINHYSAQTLEALWAFNRNAEAEGAMETLRQKVQRLMDAGQRSGLDTVSTAGYLKAYVAEESITPLPAVFLDSTGQFDATGLLSSVEVYYQSTSQQAFDTAATDEADMAAISSVAQSRLGQEPVAQNPALTVVELPAIVPDTPDIAADAPADVRAILERVQIRGDDWVITVAQGDSLGQYAKALYGDRRLFQQIFEANLAVLITPNSITVGQELVLPKG